MNDGVIKIMLVDDHPVVLEGLTAGLNQYEKLDIIGTATGVSQAREEIKKGGFDILVTDLNMPEVGDGLELIRYAGEVNPQARIVVLTYSNRPDDVFQANQAGADAYLVKDSDLDEIAEALAVVHAGGRPPLRPELEAALWRKLKEGVPQGLPHGFTEREWEVLRLVVGGATNEEIARKLFISVRVVRRDNTSIYRKLGVRNRAEAIAHSVRENWFG